MNSAESSGITAIIASAFGVTTKCDRVDRHHAQAVELLGGDHGADLRRRGRAGAAGGEQRRQHRAELADEAQADDRAERLRGAEADQRVVALQAEHHADGGAAHADDDERQHAELEELVDEAAARGAAAQQRAQRCRPVKRGEPAELLDEAQAAPSRGPEPASTIAAMPRQLRRAAPRRGRRRAASTRRRPR